MTPKEVLGMEPVSGVKIKEAPKFINYQLSKNFIY